LGESEEEDIQFEHYHVTISAFSALAQLGELHSGMARRLDGNMSYGQGYFGMTGRRFWKPERLRDGFEDYLSV
jgi:hypothetical protein